jgi:hypothetical protein
MELLMALAIGIVITGITVVVFRQAAGVYSLANAKLDAMMGTRTALDIIEKDLQGAFLPPDGNYFGGNAQMFTVCTTPVSSYAGSTLSPGAVVRYYVYTDQRATRMLVRYDFLAGTDPGGLPAPDTGPPPPSPAAPFDNPDSRALVYGLTQFTVEYYDSLADPSWDSDGDGRVDEDPTDNIDNDGDGLIDEDGPGGWVGRWNSMQAGNLHQYRRLPSAVRIVMDTVDSRGYLLRSDQTPFRVSRIFEVGTQAPGQ